MGRDRVIENFDFWIQDDADEDRRMLHARTNSGPHYCLGRDERVAARTNFGIVG